jgi:hypothetical protein
MGLPVYRLLFLVYRPEVLRAALVAYASSNTPIGNDRQSMIQSGRASHDAHHTTPPASWRGPRLIDDETVAKMGHPHGVQS